MQYDVFRSYLTCIKILRSFAFGHHTLRAVIAKHVVHKPYDDDEWVYANDRGYASLSLSDHALNATTRGRDLRSSHVKLADDLHAKNYFHIALFVRHTTHNTRYYTLR